MMTVIMFIVHCVL